MTATARRFRRSIDALPEVFQLAAHFQEAEELPPSLKFPIEFVLEEIFTNMVKYNPDGLSDLEVALEKRDGEIAISLTDFDTQRFDINTDAPHVDPNLPLSARTPGGLGVHLVKKMMDRVEYSHQNRTGTITLYKRLE